jgi:hypothetical protein
MEGFYEDPQQTTQRPPLLNTLCILTFIWAGICILTSFTQIPSLYQSTQNNEQMQTLVEQMQESNPTLGETFLKIFEIIDQHKRVNWIFSFVGNCFSLMGALMMWNMQKKGFYIYAAAELLPTLLSLCFSGFGDMLNALGGVAGGIMVSVLIAISILIIVMDIVFIGLYSSQLKYMR